MTDYEIDPDGVLADGAYVRAGDHKGTWRVTKNSSSPYVGMIIETSLPVLRGMEQHVQVLRPVVNNIPTEPGTYNVTWESGVPAMLNPFIISPDGTIKDKDGCKAPYLSDLRRATWTRIDDSSPCAHCFTGYQSCVDNSCCQSCFLGDRVTAHGIDPDWFPPQRGDVALFNGEVWTRLLNGEWVHRGYWGNDRDMRNAELLVRDGKKWIP